MITSEFVQTLARYNRWQNKSIYSAASNLSDAERRLDRGAFFGSIYHTLSHLLWGDTMWMSRFDDWDKPTAGIPESRDWVGDWKELSAQRLAADIAILEWSDRVDDASLAGTLSWYSGALRRDVSKPMALCVTHFYNHQTHHRGQVHAMLTAAGEQPEDTDLFAMPDLD